MLQGRFTENEPLKFQVTSHLTSISFFSLSLKMFHKTQATIIQTVSRSSTLKPLTCTVLISRILHLSKVTKICQNVHQTSNVLKVLTISRIE